MAEITFGLAISQLQQMFVVRSGIVLQCQSHAGPVFTMALLTLSTGSDDGANIGGVVGTERPGRCRSRLEVGENLR